MLSFSKLLAQSILGLSAVFTLIPAHAGLFDDDEARKAILDLRARADAEKLARDAADQRQAEELKQIKEGNTPATAQLRQSLLDLQNQIEALRAEVARIRGLDEQLAKDVADMQRRQKDMAQGVDDRMRQLEPTKVSLDGRDFNVEPNEKRDYDAAFAAFRKPDFPAAQLAFADFMRRYPQSGYAPSALFWLGNSQYANRDYQGAVNNFRNMIAQAPTHPKASDAALSIANCQTELKDTKGARKTLEDLMKVYPQSEAAVAAKERLARLK
jgi:tol-pal system protein YbgF